MLKHVQISPLRNRADTVSLRSSTTSSCASSMCGSPEPPTELQRTPSRASSYSSLNEQLPQTTIKVYTNCLKIDIEYKTLGIQWDTTSKEVITQLLRRLKMRHRDPRLFYLSMEVALRRAGVKTLLVLDDDTRPAILQACHPKGESRFCLQLKPGGLIRVHTSALQPTSQYKSLVISEETTSDELLQLLLGCYNSLEPVEQFSIYEVCPGQEYQRKLHPDDIPLRAQAERMKRGETCHFLVRRNPNYVTRRRQLLGSLNEAMQQHSKAYDANSTHSSLEDIDENSLLDLSIESLSDDLHSLAMTSSDDDEDCASSASSSGSSDTSTECATTTTTLKAVVPVPATAAATTAAAAAAVTAVGFCHKCRNINYKSCEFCQQNSTMMVAKQATKTSTSTSTTTSPATIATMRRSLLLHANARTPTASPSSLARSYSPVYNIREIRTATHSFSALGKDKKLLDIHLNARYEAVPTVTCRLRPHSVYIGGSRLIVDTNGNDNCGKATANATSTSAAAATATPTPTAMATAAATTSAAIVSSSSSSSAVDVNGNAASTAPVMTSMTTVAGEAVHNNPAKGLGHFVYL